MSEFISLFEQCGKAFLPGRKPPLAGPLDPVTPVSYDPAPDPPAKPTLIVFEPPPPLFPCYECLEQSLICPPGTANAGQLQQTIKTCTQCFSNVNGQPLLVQLAPPPNRPECKFLSPTCDDVPGEPPCEDGPSQGCEREAFKCIETVILCPPGFFPEVSQIQKDCISCGFTPVADPDCIFFSPDCDDVPGEPPCEDTPATPDECIPPLDPLFPGTTGGSTLEIPGTKCVTVKALCPPGTDRAGEELGIISRSCVECDRLGAPPNPPTGTPGSANAGVVGTLTTETGCSFVVRPGPVIPPNTVFSPDCFNACPPAAPITGLNSNTLQLTGNLMDQFCNETVQLPSLGETQTEPGGSGPGGGGEPGGGGGGPALDPGPGACCNFGGVPGAPTNICLIADRDTCDTAGGVHQGGGTGGVPAGGIICNSPTPDPLCLQPCIVDPCPVVQPLINPSLPGDPDTEEDLTRIFGVSLPPPLGSIVSVFDAPKLLEIQEKNATTVKVNEKLLVQDEDDLKNDLKVQKIYDKELNFFELEPDRPKTVVNSVYPSVFNTSIDVSIADALQLANTRDSWSEDIFFNLTLKKIERSLHPDLLAAFKILRFNGGEPVGLDLFLDMIKKHLVTGTIDRVDASFYVEAAKAQLQQNFTILEEARTKDYASRASINYIIENGQRISIPVGDDKPDVQLNRTRFLNEDLNLKIPLETLASGTKDLVIPNEGIPLEAITPKTSTTPASVGDSNLLNIGDGGGYYIAVSSSDGEFALRTTNLIDESFYLPDFHKSKVLALNDKSFISTITASSLNNKHEFVSGESAGATTFEPLYFGINLDSVSSTYTDNPLIERYKASYSRITDTEQISRHVNNNAQSISEFRIGFDDPIYRYILDTSAFDLEQEDFTVYGFKETLSAFDFNFVKNIPFGVIIIPVAGSKFNPLNGQSQLKNYTDNSFKRSLNFKPSIGSNIDGTGISKLTTFNLFNNDGSKRIGLVETPSFQSFGFKFDPDLYRDTFYDGETYTSSIEPVSSFGVSFLLTEVIDSLAETTSAKQVTWFDLIRRMPFNRFTELFYSTPPQIFEDIKNGFRQGIKADFVVKGDKSIPTEEIILEDDDKVIITLDDRVPVKEKEDRAVTDSDIPAEP